MRLPFMDENRHRMIGLAVQASVKSAACAGRECRRQGPQQAQLLELAIPPASSGRSSKALLQAARAIQVVLGAAACQQGQALHAPSRREQQAGTLVMG